MTEKVAEEDQARKEFRPQWVFNIFAKRQKDKEESVLTVLRLVMIILHDQNPVMVILAYQLDYTWN